MNWIKRQTVRVDYEHDGLQQQPRLWAHVYTQGDDGWGFNVGAEGIGQMNGSLYPTPEAAQHAAETALVHYRGLLSLQRYSAEEGGT